MPEDKPKIVTVRISKELHRRARRVLGDRDEQFQGYLERCLIDLAEGRVPEKQTSSPETPASMPAEEYAGSVPTIEHWVSMLRRVLASRYDIATTAIQRNLEAFDRLVTFARIGEVTHERAAMDAGRHVENGASEATAGESGSAAKKAKRGKKAS